MSLLERMDYHFDMLKKRVFVLEEIARLAHDLTYIYEVRNGEGIVNADLLGELKEKIGELEEHHDS